MIKHLDTRIPLKKLGLSRRMRGRTYIADRERLERVVLLQWRVKIQRAIDEGKLK